MAVDQGLIDWVAEAMEQVGIVTSKRLFGGATLYVDDVAFAIVAFDALWFKADAQSDPLWDSVAAPRFTVERAGGRYQSMNYRRAPDGVYDDCDELMRWGLLALDAGRRAPTKSVRRRQKRTSPRER
jgi:DNA transformation protein and related proteins